MIFGTIGVRYKHDCHPDDLWTTYFTSSVYVDIQRWLYGEPDVIEVRQTFRTKEKSKSWESKVLRRMRVVKSEHWLNKTDNRCPTTTGLILGPRSQETKQKIRQSLLGRSIPHKGTPHTDEWKKNISSLLKRQDEVRRTQTKNTRIIKTESLDQKKQSKNLKNLKQKNIK